MIEVKIKDSGNNRIYINGVCNVMNIPKDKLNLLIEVLLNELSNMKKKEGTMIKDK